MQRDSLVTYENHMKTILRVLSCSDTKDKGFLLKIYLENHKPRVDGNASACASTHQHTYHYYDAICQNSSRGNRERKHARSEKIKIAISAISAYASRMMRLKIKSVVSRKERL